MPTTNHIWSHVLLLRHNPAFCPFIVRQIPPRDVQRLKSQVEDCGLTGVKIHYYNQVGISISGAVLLLCRLGLMISKIIKPPMIKSRSKMSLRFVDFF